MFHTQATGGCVESHSLADQSHAQSRRTQETQEVLFSSHHARRASQWVRVSAGCTGACAADFYLHLYKNLEVLLREHAVQALRSSKGHNGKNKKRTFLFL